MASHADHHSFSAASHKKDKKVKYLLVGTGNQYALAKQMIHRLNLTKNVILGGAIPYQQMPQYVNTATITLAIFDEKPSND